MGVAADVDPLALALAPPPDETDEQRALRLQEEEQARLVSEEIDEQIRQERAAMKRQKRPIKVLLLGQSESGECARPFVGCRVLCEGCRHTAAVCCVHICRICRCGHPAHTSCATPTTYLTVGCIISAMTAFLFLRRLR